MFKVKNQYRIAICNNYHIYDYIYYIIQLVTPHFSKSMLENYCINRFGI